MVKKDKRIDNPLFEKTTDTRSSVASATIHRSKAKKSRNIKQAKKTSRSRIIDEVVEEVKEVGKSIEELKKIRGDLKDRLVRMDKDTEKIDNLDKKFIFVNRFEDSAEIDTIESDSNVIAEWGEAETIEKDDDLNDGRGDIFQVIRDLENELNASGVLNDSLDIELTETRKELGINKSAREEMTRKIRTLEETANLSEELLEKLAFSEEEKNKALKRRTDLENELEFLLAEKRGLETEFHESKMKLKDIEKTSIDLGEEINLLKEKNTLLDDIHDDLTYTIARKDKDLERLNTLEAELEAISTTKDAIDLDFRTSKKVIHRFKEEQGAMETRMAYLEEENRRLESQLTSAKDETRDSNERVQQLARELGATRATKNNLDAECNILRKTIEDIHGALVYTKRKATKRPTVKNINSK